MAVTDPRKPRAPDPLREEPPADRFCDLILNGGIASGVVYPWALLELARHYRFRNIGGNSAGAIAAALAAAAEYGRCNGVETAFEPLRLTPQNLAETVDGKTKLLRLFQPKPSLSRLFELFVTLVEDPPEATVAADRRNRTKWNAVWGLLFRLHVARYFPFLVLAALGIVFVTTCALGWVSGSISLLLVILLLVAAIALLIVTSIARALQEVARNGYGLCPGKSQNDGEEGLVEWLHRGVQLSAGRGRDDPPLTFADLWAARRFGRAGPVPLEGGLQPEDAGIALQMFASNVTQGRPVRLPLNDPNTRLFYRPDQWAACFPEYLMKALFKASTPYGPMHPGDPDPSDPRLDPGQRKLAAALMELPSGGMPIVVATRLSLCFPFLFSCVPVYAVDYEDARGQRKLRQCLLSDGGLCTNFPIHLFDAAHPRWPTFGFLLDKRLKARAKQALWLPRFNLQGRADNWQPGVPEMIDPGEVVPSLLDWTSGLLGGLLGTMKDWNDRVTTRLPQVRNRVIRLALQSGEGQLNLRMPKETILHMAYEYGAQAGKKLVEAFAPDRHGIKRAWKDHLYVRSMIELRSLHRHLRRYGLSVRSRGINTPLAELFEARTPPLAVYRDTPDPGATALTDDQRDALDQAVQAVEALETRLTELNERFGPYRPVVEPELHLRPPM